MAFGLVWFDSQQSLILLTVSKHSPWNWKSQLTDKNLSYFPTYKTLVDQGTAFSCDQYVAAIKRLQQESLPAICLLQVSQCLFLDVCRPPLSCDVDSAPSELQMELTDLQCSSDLKAKFREAQGKCLEMIGQFLRESPPIFPELSKLFKWVMCLFGSTYLCEKLFSTVNFNKLKHRSRLTDAHL